VLDNVDRRKVERIKAFFLQIPFFNPLPRSMLNTLHLSLTRKRCQRGQILSRQGQDSLHLFIVICGEFEVSKVIDTSKLEKPDKTTNPTGR